MLRTVQQIRTAVGDYGNLQAEVIDDGNVKTVTVKVKGGLLDTVSGKGVRSGPKFRFTDIQEMRDLSALLLDAVEFLKEDN